MERRNVLQMEENDKGAGRKAGSFLTCGLLMFLVVALLFLLPAGMLAKEYHYRVVKGDPMQSRIYQLDNGLTVYLSVNKEKPRVQTYIAVKTGSRNDPAETTGLAHYLEHLMFKGTQQFGTTDYQKERPLLDDIERRYEVYRRLADPDQRRQAYHEIDSVSQLAARYNIPNEYDKLMAAIGAEGTNAYTSNDVTCYVEDIPANEMENWARVQSDRFQHMVIRGFHTELESVYEEYNIGLGSDNSKLWNAVNALVFPGHPYGTQTTIGTQEHLKNPSITNIKNYFNRYYVPNNVAICMAGDLDPDKTIELIDKYFGTWCPNPALSRPEYAPVREITAPIDSTVVGPESEKVALAWKMPAANSLAADTLAVISEILSNGKAGLIDLNLSQPMRVLDAGAFYEGLHDYGLFLLMGLPKEGQALEEVRALLLQEVDKLKRGDFADDLLPSVINNIKVDFYRSLEKNDERADLFVNAFINDQRWEDVVGSLERKANMTKEEIVAFANRYFKDNFACVYKRQGEDKTQKKIDKPAITPIPSNRQYTSRFLEEVQGSHVAPIQPQFVDFKRDLIFSKTKKGLPVIYKENTENGLFDLCLWWGFGTAADKRYDIAADYLDLLGTDKKSAEQIKQSFYQLGCSFSLSVNNYSIALKLSGLDEHMPQALALAEDLLANAKVDHDAYGKFVGKVLKNRMNNKKNQRANFAVLRTLGRYGAYNDQLNIMSEQELKDADPQQLLALLKKLNSYEHEVLYYGPTPLQQLAKLMDKSHRTPKQLAKPLVNKEYMEQPTPQNEVWIAPYDAKNIYMQMYHCAGKSWSPAEAPVAALFNEYFGGGMNTVVFQELREARGLAYSASAYYNNLTRKGHPEYGQTYIISQNDKMMDCVSVFNQILDTIPQSQGAFELAKQSLAKQLASARTTKFNLISKYINNRALGIDYDLNEKIYQALPSITLQDIVDFEQRTMAHKPYRYLILGDEKNLDMKALEKIGPIRRLTTEEIFGY